MNVSMSKMWIAMGCLVASTQLHAGWISGGGEMIQDGANPWFIQNTKTVTYCTQYGSHFSLATEVADKMVADALAFWKDEFSRGQSIFEPRIEVATQNFVKVECPNGRKDVDIAFQFDVLDDQQREFIKNPEHYAALTIRTDYDSKVLKGRGFIYVSPDSGPNRFVGRDLVDLPWSFNNGGLLYWTLVHELGHVFGMQHTTQRAETKHVMAFDFVETILSKESAPRFVRDLNVAPIFQASHHPVGDGLVFCPGNSQRSRILRRFFGVPESEGCIEWTYAGGRFKVFVLRGLERVLWGESRSGDGLIFSLLSSAMNFWLPKEQTVFPANTKYVKTPSYYVTDGTSEYRSLDGATVRQMSFSFDPRADTSSGISVKFGGIMDGKLYANLIEGI